MLITPLFLLLLASTVSAKEEPTPPTLPVFEAPETSEFSSSVLIDPFVELSSTWQRSKALQRPKVGDQAATDTYSHVKYDGEWRLASASEASLQGDQGLLMASPARHHCISRVLDRPLLAQDQDIVVQYDMKLEKGWTCGGAYLKLLTSPGDVDGEQSLSADEAPLDVSVVDNNSPYAIMFGPDKCGSTNKVHLILRRRHPKTLQWQEHHLKAAPSVPSDDARTHLYTLILHGKQNTYEIRIDASTVKEGNLFTDFEPPLEADKEVDDENDKKPSDWVDDAEIDDPNAVKPADWDESEPRTIPDLNAKQPADWRSDLSPQIPDPNSLPPADWDVEEDGDWSAPLIPNPECNSISGCGEWQRPQIPNPKYKGTWRPPRIANPAYRGVWEPRRIPNPDYYKLDPAAAVPPIRAVAFELWTIEANVLFDNVFVGTNVKEAEAFAEKTFTKKRDAEKVWREYVTARDGAKQAEMFKDDPSATWQVQVSRWVTRLVQEGLSWPLFVATPWPIIAVSSIILVLSVLIARLVIQLWLPEKKEQVEAADEEEKEEEKEEIVAEDEAEVTTEKIDVDKQEKEDLSLIDGEEPANEDAIRQRQTTSESVDSF